MPDPGAISARLEWLRTKPYFVVLSSDDLAFIAGRIIARDFSKGEQIFAEGEPCQGLYIVFRGQVRVYKLSAEGREQVLRNFKDGESFNEVAVFDGGPNPAHADATTPSTLWIIPRRLIFELARTRPEMAVAIIQNLGSQLRHLVGLVEDLSLRHISARLVRLLLETPAGGPNASKLTQQEMATQLGTVREMVARALKQLESRGLIEIKHGRIVIVDRQTLEKMT
jgi:CRP-like cAMP-binding protein